MQYDFWKPVKLYICKTPGMVLFMSLSSMTYNIDYSFNPIKRLRPRKFDKFPYEITDCRCKYCRYQRIFKK